MEKERIKLLIIPFLFFISILSIIVISNNLSYKFEEEIANINELYIYGNHLNLKGTLEKNINLDKLELVLFNGKEKKYELLFEKQNNIISFYISSKKNNGILLDSLNISNNMVFLKATTNKKVKYYKLHNKTDYKETEYYTIRKNNNFNKILIKESKDTLNINVIPSKEDNIYDIVVDAGHGGIDKGACYNGECERGITLALAKKLKQELEKEGLKVKLTREDDITDDIKFETYGTDGRIDRAMSSKAKYLFSFHLNSGLQSMTGTEIYTTNNIDYTLAHSIVNSIVKNTNTNYSNNSIFRVDKGIYTRTFREHEITSFEKELKDKKIEPYNITTNTTYYYIIRETGGFMNGAYVDGRDNEKNEYYNTNVGLESYIMELGYISNIEDTKDIKDNMDKYVSAIKEAIIENICK